MTVGIVMPTYNQVEFLADAVRSVVSQSHTDWELVIVDDGSDDGTWESALGLTRDEPRARLTRHKSNRGAAAAINTGIDLLRCCGWLAWVSSDNVMNTVWLSTLLAAADERTGALYGGFHYCRLPRGPIRYMFEPHEPRKLISQEACYYGPAFLVRREVWEEAGPHRGAISHDYDHWLRVEEACWELGLEIVGVDRSLCRYLAHDQRATVVRADTYDAPHWQMRARVRRDHLLVP